MGTETRQSALLSADEYFSADVAIISQDANGIRRGRASDLIAAIPNFDTSSIYETWSALNAVVGADGDGATVVDGDAGNHTDPVTSIVVSNAGIYKYQTAAPAGWKRIGNSVAAQTSQDASAAETAKNTAVSSAEISTAKSTIAVTAAADALLSEQAAAASALANGPVIGSVLVAATTNIALAGEQTIDGELTSTSRVLLTGQTDASQNGVWTTAAGAWARYDSASHASGMIASVEKGSGAGQWTLTTPDPIVVETDELTFVQLLSNDSDRVSYQYGATGTKARSMKVKGEDTLHVDDFLHGVVGIDDLTAALKLFHDTVHTTRKRGILAGREYVVNGPISSDTTHATGGLHLHIDGAAKITADPATPFAAHLLYCATTAPCDVSITGSSLHIDLNDRIAQAIYGRHYASAQGGQAVIEAPLLIENVHNGLSSGAAYGIALFGNFAQANIRNASVENVSRSASVSESKGIVISGFTGKALVENCRVGLVTCPSGAADADGIALFAKQTGGIYGFRSGEAIARDCALVDCSGRMIKLQSSEAKVIGAYIKRQNIVGISDATDIDFQFGNGEVLDTTFEYLENGGVSPLGSSHVPIAFQQILDDMQMVSRVSGVTMKTQVAMPRLVSVLHNQSSNDPAAQDARYSHTIVEKVKVDRIFGFTGSAFTRGIVETPLDPVAVKAEAAKITITDVVAPTNMPALAYTGLDASDDMSSKFSYHIDNVENTMGGAPAVISNISGSALTEAKDFHIGTMRGFKTLMTAGWTFGFSDLKPGCAFSVDISTVVAAPAPGWGSSGYALIECGDQWFGASDKNITVTKDGGNAANTIFKTRDSGATWNTIK